VEVQRGKWKWESGTRKWNRSGNWGKYICDEEAEIGNRIGKWKSDAKVESRSSKWNWMENKMKGESNVERGSGRESMES
jgi:hypothetical protein